MNDIEKRTIEEADYMIKKDKTIRQIAKKFKVSKSTVHKDLKERLKKLNLNLHTKVQNIILIHIKTRHIKGGKSTKKKYQKLTKTI